MLLPNPQKGTLISSGCRYRTNCRVVAETLPRQRFGKSDSFSWLHKWNCSHAPTKKKGKSSSILGQKLNTFMLKYDYERHALRERERERELWGKQLLRMRPQSVHTLRIRSVLRYACLMFKPRYCCVVCVCVCVCVSFFMMTCQTFMQNANLKPSLRHYKGKFLLLTAQCDAVWLKYTWNVAKFVDFIYA